MVELAVAAVRPVGRGTPMVSIGLQSCLAFIFVTAGMTKLFLTNEEPLGFLMQFGLQSVSARRLMIVVAIVELIVGLWLISGFRAGIAAMAAIILLTLFQTAILWVGIRFGWNRNCPCGLGVFSLPWVSVRNVLCMAACVLIVRLQVGWPSLARRPTESRPR